LSDDDYLSSPGFVLDFKELKSIVKNTIESRFDHHTILSNEFLAAHPSLSDAANIWVWTAEPTAENILIYIRNTLRKALPADVVLRKLKIYETSDSYAEWEDK
jgi:6-pyruvoyltetrahydropterin/6-carboxytetrahydropterin synthase